MSNTQQHVHSDDCDCHEVCDSIKMILAPKDKDLGGFTVRRLLPTHKMKTVGPWIFFDHMGPAQFAPGEGINVKPHPHIGLATVTYLFDGEMLHRDSLGSVQVIRPGDINLMVAGKGIVHSEREQTHRVEQHRSINGLQLWIALPSEHEQRPPAFYHYPTQDIPATEIDGVSIRVMMGDAYNLHSPVMTFSKTLYVEAHLQPGQTLALPQVQELGVYVVQGSLQCKVSTLSQHSMAIFDEPSDMFVSANEPAHIVMIGGHTMAKRYIEWNFVSSTKELIEHAKTDWKSGHFPKVPGDDEFIPLP
ncbi:pirin family protein [Pseudoalteromonas sp. SSDWG2]|uniref:pirin family protein n=1 Tax=Pseudoalteromonas sp. SSDWG2 TaxID=3139391 RepID=UPI003BA97AA0